MKAPFFRGRDAPSRSAAEGVEGGRRRENVCGKGSGRAGERGSGGARQVGPG